MAPNVGAVVVLTPAPRGTVVPPPRRRPPPRTLGPANPWADGGSGRGFERTAGDEIQGVCEAPEEVLDIVTTLIRHGQWRIGIGIGPVDLPLPDSPREGRGAAFVAARDAVQAAHPVPGQLAVRARFAPATARGLREASGPVSYTHLTLPRRELV